MAQGPSDTILVAIRITLRIRESIVRNPDPPDRRRFVLSEHIISCFVYFAFIFLERDCGKDCQARELNREDAIMDRIDKGRLMTTIGCVVAECFFWYRLTALSQSETESIEP